MINDDLLELFADFYTRYAFVSRMMSFEDYVDLIYTEWEGRCLVSVEK